jgi:hypothetical protein
MSVSIVSPIMITSSVRRPMRLRAASDQPVSVLGQFEVQHSALTNDHVIRRIAGDGVSDLAKRV